MDRSAIFRQRVEAACPDLVIETVSLNDSGQFNNVLVVNHRLVFRFPRYAQQARRLPAQVDLLQRLQKYLDVPIPDPVFAGLDSATPGEAFIGYPMILGAPLRRETLKELTDQGFSTVVSQLADFLRNLHTIPPAAVTASLVNEDDRDHWVGFYARVRDRLFPSMRPDARTAVAQHFEEFLDDPSSFEYEPVIRHGDFGPENILLDATAEKISGVIDFDFAGLGDAATDLAIMLSPGGYGEEFERIFRSRYPVDDAVISRGRFYRGTWALQEALHGTEEGDQGAFDRGIGLYRYTG